MFSKDNIRDHMKEIRGQMSEEMVKKASAACVSQILSLTEYKESKIILAYAAASNEVDLTLLIEDALAQNKMVGLPISGEDGQMDFYELFDFSDLRKGRFGIMEPSDDILITNDEALIFVPGVAYDIRKNRIGHGGGYYDRYFERFPNLYKIGMAYDEQIVDAFETNEFDKPVDLIITPSQMII